MSQGLETGTGSNERAYRPTLHSWTDHAPVPAVDLSGTPQIPVNWTTAVAHDVFVNTLDLTTHGKLKALVDDAVKRHLKDSYGAKPSVLDAHVDYAERKIRDAYSSVPYVRSVSYRQKTDRWVLVIVHENPAKGEAHLALIGKLCDISRDDALMPVFEPWIIHVSDAGASSPAVEKHIISR